MDGAPLAGGRSRSARKRGRLCRALLWCSAFDPCESHMERIEREPITIYAKTAHAANRDRCRERLVTKAFASGDVADMYFYGRAVHREERVAERDARVSIACGVKDDPRALSPRLMNAFNEGPLIIALERVELPTKAQGFLRESLLKRSELRDAITLWLSRSEEVSIWTVEEEEATAGRCSDGLSFDCLRSDRPSRTLAHREAPCCNRFSSRAQRERYARARAREPSAPQSTRSESPPARRC